MGVGHALDLFADSGLHLGIAMPQAGHRRAATGIEVALACGIDQMVVYSKLAGNGDAAVTVLV